MAWTASLNVSVGDATKETDYDQLVANAEYLQTLANAEHDFHVGTGDGGHKSMTFPTGATLNFNSGDIVLTHSSNTLTLTGGTGVGFAAATTDCKFGVYHSAGTANVTGDGTAFTMTYQTEVFDTGNDFASNTFTAPVTGQYLFTCMVSLAGVLAAHTDGRIEIVTTQGDQMKIFAAGKIFESNTIVRPHISAIMDMDAGDTAYIRLTVYNAAKVVDLQNTYLSNQFSGAIQ